MTAHLVTLLVEALEKIRDLEPIPYEWPQGWREERDACAECKRWEGHPIQQGICDAHRRPFYAQERHELAESMAIGVRARRIARDVLEIARGS